MELPTAVSTGGIAKRARLPRGLPTWDHSQYQLDCYDARITMSLVGMEWWPGTQTAYPSFPAGRRPVVMCALRWLLVRQCQEHFGS
jgi:hypothetical protein